MIGCALLSLGLLSLQGFSFAQEEKAAIDESTLVRLYESSLRYPEDAYLQKRIAEERTRISNLVEKEVQGTIDTLANAPAEGEGSDLPKALDRQRKIVATLEEQLQEKEVDLDLLSEEEKAYYLEPIAGTGALEEYRLTRSFPELLAKKAILEEHVAILKASLPLQQERLAKLTKQNRLEQFAVLIRIGITIGILLLIVLLEKTIRTMFLRKIQQHTKRYLLTKLFTFTVYVVAIIWVLTKLFSEQPGILASFAIVGAGLAVSLQDIVKDVVGWFTIMQKRPFSLGDRISIGSFTGDVIDISILRTTLLEVGTSTQSEAWERTGKTLYLPNALLLTRELLNYNTTSDFTKAEMQVTVTYEGDWKKAETILQEILVEETQQFTEKEQRQSEKRTWLFYVSDETKVPQVYTDLASDGVLFILRFSVPVGRRREVISKISQKILEHFEKEPHIELAYRTSRVFPVENPAIKTGRALP
jgi:small-conductance mechanosensitive channel